MYSTTTKELTISFSMCFRIFNFGQDSKTHRERNSQLFSSSRIHSLTLDKSHTFVEIDHEIISTVILLPSAESFKKGCCQLQAKVCARSTG